MGIRPTGGVCGGVGDFWAAVAVGCGLAVGVDLDSLELLRNPCSWRHTEGMQPMPVSRQTAHPGNRCTGSMGGAAVGAVHTVALTVILAEGEECRTGSISDPAEKVALAVRAAATAS